MHKNEMISNEIEKWLSEGSIDATTASTLLSQYPIKVRNFNLIRMIVFSVIGAVFLVTGFIMLFGQNWDDLPEWQRLSMAFLPLLLGQGLSVFTYLKRRDHTAWIESSGIFLSGGAIATFAMVCQVLQLRGETAPFYLICMLMILPAVYLLRSTSANIIYQILLTAWIFASHRDLIDLGYYILLFGALVPQYTQLVRQNRFSIKSQILFIFGAITISIFMIGCVNHFIYDTYETYSVMFAFVFTMLFITDRIWFHRSETRWQNLIGILSYGGIVVMAYLLDEFHYYNHSTHNFSNVILIWSFLTIIPTILLLKAPRKAVNLTAELFMLITFATYFLSFENTISAFIFNLIIHLYIISLGVSMLYDGLKEHSLLKINIGMVITLFYAYTKFVFANGSLFENGLKFIVFGLIFITVNILMSRKFRSKKEEQPL